MPTIEELKAKLKQLNRRTKKPQDLWRPTGKNVCRFVECPDSVDPFVTLTFHYGIGKHSSILCPNANFGLQCDVCDLCSKLTAWKDEDGNDRPEAERKADFEVFKNIQPKAQLFVPLIERGKEDAGAKWYRITPYMFGQLLEKLEDSDRRAACGLDPDEEDASKVLGMLTNPERAYDVDIKLKKAGEDGNDSSFDKTTIEPKITLTPLTKSKKEAKELLSTLKPITDVYPVVTSEEVTKMLSEWVNSQTSTEPDTTPSKEKYEKNSTEDVKNVGSRSIEEAFADLQGAQ